MNAYICGIGWVTGAGLGWGKQGGEFTMPDLPLPPLTRKDVFPEPNQRFGRMSEYTKLGLAAVTFALRDAGMEEWTDKRPIGVVASTRLGCLATDLEYHKTVLLDGGGLASPNLFAYTLANCFLGDAAIQFGLTGSSFAINETGEDDLGAVRLALEDLELGETETMLAGICDLAVPEAFADCVSVKPGAVFLVLAVTAPAATNNYGIVTLTDDGGILHNGSATSSLSELVQSALTGYKSRPGIAPPCPREASML
jgi:3-oxoacyl-[acyl-carrier-protein] synthase II